MLSETSVTVTTARADWGPRRVEGRGEEAFVAPVRGQKEDPRAARADRGASKDGREDTRSHANQDGAAHGAGAPRGVDGDPLTEAEARQIQHLKRRDAEVRQHEQAHMAAGGGHVRGVANYQYQTGPDGRRYAAGGEVKIDTSRASTPEQTVRKMEAVRRAALAPSRPSTQDRRVAAVAARRALAARVAIRREGGKTEEDETPTGSGPANRTEMREADSSAPAASVSDSPLEKVARTFREQQASGTYGQARANRSEGEIAPTGFASGGNLF